MITLYIILHSHCNCKMSDVIAVKVMPTNTNYKPIINYYNEHRPERSLSVLTSTDIMFDRLRFGFLVVVRTTLTSAGFLQPLDLGLRSPTMISTVG